jgi:hypothetical protein
MRQASRTDRNTGRQMGNRGKCHRRLEIDLEIPDRGLAVLRPFPGIDQTLECRG